MAPTLYPEGTTESTRSRWTPPPLWLTIILFVLLMLVLMGIALFVY